MSAAACGDCRFHRTVTDAEGALQMACRRHAPIVIYQYVPSPRGLSLVTQSCWPTVGREDWCGEHAREDARVLED